NSGVIGRRLLDKIDRTASVPATLSEQAVLTGLRTVIALVSRELGGTLISGVEIATLIERMRTDWQGAAFPRENAAFLAVWLEIAEGCATSAAGLLYGAEEVFTQGRTRIAQAAERAVNLRQPFAFWAADRVGLLVDQMHDRSVFRVLANKNLPEQYL